MLIKALSFNFENIIIIYNIQLLYMINFSVESDIPVEGIAAITVNC